MTSSARRRRPLRAIALVAALGAVVFTSGCGEDADAGPSGAADGFEQALSAGDGQAACSLLTAATLDELESSSGKACDKAILDEAKAGGARRDVARFGTMAQVRLDQDVLFLAQSPEGWRVMAAACRPRPGGQPYDCDVAGG